MSKILSKQAQTLLEYLLLIVLVVAAIVMVGPFIKRSWNASVKGWEDSIVDSRNDPLRSFNPSSQPAGCYGGFVPAPCRNPPCCGYGTCGTTEEATNEWRCFPSNCLCGPPPQGQNALTCTPSYACGLPQAYNPNAQCTGPALYRIKNALLCQDDDIFLQRNTRISTVPNGFCDPTVKCEVECLPTYVPSPTKQGCVCPPGQQEFNSSCGTPTPVGTTYFTGLFNLDTGRWGACDVPSATPTCDHTVDCNHPSTPTCGTIPANTITKAWPNGFNNPPNSVICRSSFTSLGCVDFPVTKPTPQVQPQTIDLLCESINYVYQPCVVTGNSTQVLNIQLLTQYSRSGCAANVDYGIIQPNQIFVDNGCRADFRVTYQP